MGFADGAIMGSFIHLMDRDEGGDEAGGADGDGDGDGNARA